MKLFRPSTLAGGATLATLVAMGGALGVALSGVAAGPAYAAAGGLDPAFGTGGTVVTSANYIGSAPPSDVMIQPNGEIVVIAELTDPATDGDFGAVRYQANGTLDAGFGTGGEARASFTNFINTPYDAALQPDGKIVVVGNAQSADGTLSEFALVRFNTNGTLDSSFGTGGKVTTNFVGVHAGGVFNPATSVLIQPNGDILVGGSALALAKTPTLTALARYNANGSLDTSFGTGGTVAVNAIGPVAALGEDAAGGIFAVGTSGKIAEFSAAGVLQASVTASPITVASTGGISSTAFQANGTYLIGQTGAGVTRRDADAQVVRYLPTGAVDPSFTNPPFDFAAEGTVASDTIQALAVEPSGQVVVTGLHSAVGSSTIGIARLDSTGALDTTFATGGVETTVAGQGSAIAVQPDGKIVVAGELFRSGLPVSLVVERFLGQ
jgi:uncharacterized delta-60 repeat protein